MPSPNKQLRLIDIIERINKFPDDIFLNIYHDLDSDENISPDSPPIIKMAYAYALHIVVGGLFLQGIFVKDNFHEASSIVNNIQIAPEQKTTQFKKEAAQQTNELLHSYDTRLCNETNSTIIKMARFHAAMNYESVISRVQKVKEKINAKRMNKIDEVPPMTIQNKQLRLIDVIKKVYNQPEGIFANINNDLNESITMDHPPIIKMAYAYARRTAAAGLFLQGVFDREAYEHASRMFKVYQQQTGHTVEFQEEAAQQSNELFSSYDLRLDKEITKFITSMVEHGQTPEQYDGVNYFTYDSIISKVHRAIYKQQ